MDIKIVVATHKRYWMPDDPVYLPLQVGRSLHKNEDLGYLGDDTGDNISERNESFCELTGLYWAWKNIKCEYIGFCHYRRYFAHRNFGLGIKGKRREIFSRCDYEELLKAYDIILPHKRNYFIESVHSHYKHAHYIKDLEEASRILGGKYPEYIDAYQRVMKSHRLYLYNMFVMRKKLFDEYCKWLFDIEFELEKRIDIKSYDTYNARVFGFIAERLFNVWIEKNGYTVIEKDVIHLEKVNWIKKIYHFLVRKYG